MVRAKTAPQELPPRLALLHGDAVSNLAELKKQLWAITNYALLADAALLASSRALEGDGFRILLAAVAGLTSIAAIVLQSLTQAGLIKFRKRIRLLYENHYTPEEWAAYDLSLVPKGFWYGWPFYVGLCAVIVLGGALAVLLIVAS